MIDLSHKKLLTTVPLIISLVACATPDHDSESISSAEYTAAEYQTTQYSMAQNYDLDLVEYTVKDGDRLSVIAKEITGQASAWHEIAEFNSIDNPRNLLPGTVLAIPTELIVDHHRSNEALRAQSTQIRPTAQAGASALAVRLNEADNARVVITPINTNRDFKLNPIDPNAPRPTQNYSGHGTQIKVIGSYYPKGIYTEPAAYSKLILRAAPGTLFVVDSQVNGWYKIDTVSGSGYIRTSDAAIVEKNE